MTFPGVQGIRGPSSLMTPTGQQIRQSTAGSYPGGSTWTTVLDAMGSNAPAWGITAKHVTVMQEYAQLPRPMALENFELPLSEGGVDQFGVDQTSPSVFVDILGTQPADITGLAGQELEQAVIASGFPLTFPVTFQVPEAKE